MIEPGSQAANPARRGETHGGVRAERVYLDESGSEHEIAPCSGTSTARVALLGYRIGAVETPDVLHDSTNPYADLSSAAQVWAENVWVLLEEDLIATGYGLPRDCSPGAITWI